ncbi:arylsulfatase B-like [Amphiura filiformis]|uniref:arylsulfatase B-like n=1 Tax=Amphiura filiformis TaxID=82378 RepID=UPI003B2284B0
MTSNIWMKSCVVTLSVLSLLLIMIISTGKVVVVDNVTRLAKHVRRDPESGPRKKPNIIFILADDLGWNDVSYHNSSCDIHTPNIDRLAKEGVRLENYYAQSVCTPSRASFMTGLYKSRHGLENVLAAGEAGCLPNNLEIMPQILKRHGYTTHLVGKWHLGFSRRNCLPNQRGFDTFLGFHNGALDYYRHTHGNPSQPKDPDIKYFAGFDFWENEKVAEDYTGQYATHIFVKRAQEIIANHTQNVEPFFLFLSLSAVHTPLQVPQNYIEQYEGKITDQKRKIHAGMTSCMDEGMKNLTDTLQRLDVWKDTVLVFSSDNGGAVYEGASNIPLLGHKGRFTEGGIRVVGFVNSPLLSKQVQGTNYTGLMGIADWLPTFVEGIAGGSKDPKLDGVNMWESIRYGTSSPRKEYLYEVGGNCNWNEGDEPLTMYGTIRIGDWKLHLGGVGQRIWPNDKDQQMREIHFNGTCSSELHTLHNIRFDPYEKHNLYQKEHDVRATLLKKLKYHCRRKVPTVQRIERKEANPQLRQGVFTPWLDDWNYLEWHPTKADIEHTKKRYCRWEEFCGDTGCFNGTI